MAEITAKLKYSRVAPRKARLAADLIRGKSVKDAFSRLLFSTKKTAPIIAKLLKSAVSNAKHNFKIGDNADKLYVKKISVDEGPTLKRMMPRARGSAYLIRKRSSHISLVLEEKQDAKKTKKS